MTIFAFYFLPISIKMGNKSFVRAFLPLLLIFIVMTALLIVMAVLDIDLKMSPPVMLSGNLILFLATAISFYLYRKSLANNNVQVFLRMIYGGMFVKMMVCLFAALIYIGIAQKGVSKGAIFGCMFLYFLYAFTEIWIIMKLSKQNKNA